MTEEHFNRLIIEYCHIREVIDEYQKQAEDAKKLLLEYMESNGIKDVDTHNHRIKYSKGKTTTKFDRAWLALDNEELYKKYCTEFNEKQFIKENKEVAQQYLEITTSAPTLRLEVKE